jgi:hypothetical protein
MSDEDFRSDIRTAVRKHDPSPEQLRALADDLEQRADRAELTEEMI